MHRFDTPALVREPAGQAIEQLGMSGFLPEEAKVIHGGHDALIEVPGPNAVHRHARGQRMLGAGEPAGEFEAAALIRLEGGRFGLQRGLNDLDEATRHRLPEREMTAADVERQFLENPRRVRDGESGWQIGQVALHAHHVVLHRVELISDGFGIEDDGLRRKGEEAFRVIQHCPGLMQQRLAALVRFHILQRRGLLEHERVVFPQMRDAAASAQGLLPGFEERV